MKKDKEKTTSQCSPLPPLRLLPCDSKGYPAQSQYYSRDVLLIQSNLNEKDFKSHYFHYYVEMALEKMKSTGNDIMCSMGQGVVFGIYKIDSEHYYYEIVKDQKNVTVSESYKYTDSFISKFKKDLLSLRDDIVKNL